MDKSLGRKLSLELYLIIGQDKLQSETKEKKLKIKTQKQNFKKWYFNSRMSNSEFLNPARK
jgi:hypothetical protein